MEKIEPRVESAYLKKSLEEGAVLRLSLADGDRILAVLTKVGRYEVNLKSEEAEFTIPKKDISYISYLEPHLPESFFAEAPEVDVQTSRSKVQDEFLARYVKEKTLALLRLVNGDQLRGVVEGFDGFTISIKAGRGQALVYKHGLHSIGPGYRRN